MPPAGDAPSASSHSRDHPPPGGRRWPYPGGIPLGCEEVRRSRSPRCRVRSRVEAAKDDADAPLLPALLDHGPAGPPRPDPDGESLLGDGGQNLQELVRGKRLVGASNPTEGVVAAPLLSGGEIEVTKPHALRKSTGRPPQAGAGWGTSVCFSTGTPTELPHSLHEPS